MGGGSVRSYDYENYKEILEEYYKSMTSENLQALYDLQRELINLRMASFEHSDMRSRSGELVLTNLDQAYFWLQDLIKEVWKREDRDHNKN